jgi:hypothetical protein
MTEPFVPSQPYVLILSKRARGPFVLSLSKRGE